MRESRRSRVSGWLLCLVLALSAAATRAAEVVIPARIPLQGFLTDAAGDPINREVVVQLELYEAAEGGSSLFTEVQTVSAVNGVFNAMLGDVNTLDSALFKSLAVYYVGVRFDGDLLTPRLRFGSVPYAVHAADGVPTGAVMSFDLTLCPPGWTEYTNARGRSVVGLPSAGSLGGLVGTAYTNLELRNHNHSASVSIEGVHTHSVDPAAVTSASTQVPHNHFIDPPLQITNFHAHSHVWGEWANNNQRTWTTFDADGETKTLISYSSNGLMPTAGGIFFPVAKNLPIAEDMHTSEESHNHSFDIVGFQSASASASTAHTHSVDVAPTPTTSNGGHSHTVGIGNAAAGAPYVQLLMCRKS